MANIANQKIHTTLFGDGSESISVVRSDIWIPDHTHAHNSLSGLRDPAAHPQYLTEEKGADLFRSLMTQYLQTGTSGIITNGQNLGSGLGVFAATASGIMQFYTLEAGANTILTQVGNSIVISNQAGGFTFESFDAVPTVTPAWGINPVNGNIVETGGIIATLEFQAVFSVIPDSTSLISPTPITYVPETDLVATLGTTMVFDTTTVIEPITMPAIGNWKTWTMAAIKTGAPSVPINRTKSFQTGARVYYGTGNPSVIVDYPIYVATPFPNFHTACTSWIGMTADEKVAITDMITGFSSSVQSTKASQFAATAAADNKVFYAYPTSFGTPANFLVDAFPDGFFKVADDITIVNQFGISVNYTLYESDIAGLGSVTVQVT